jgi:Holliday junction resolvasome RuvABC endonuclease subunit
MRGKQAVSIWNKFSQFGIQMLVEVGKEHPKTIIGIDNGTKFEGYVVVTGKENNLAVMWKLPDKKHIVKKLIERRMLRRTRRQRNCRRRECKSDNRSRTGFIAPSQKVMVLSRLKAMQEFFKCYPIDSVVIEDVCFNHRDHKWGKNFSTVEIGKVFLYNWIRQRAGLQTFTGYATANCREKYDYKKSSDKSAEVFNAHCSDALAIATEIYAQEHIEQGKFLVVDDTYRPVRRRLHDTQFSKGHIRHPYSSGNFKGVRKGVMCNLGQICGGTRNLYFIRNQENKRISKLKLVWLSHKFKRKEDVQIPHYNKIVVSLLHRRL